MFSFARVGSAGKVLRCSDFLSRFETSPSAPVASAAGQGSSGGNNNSNTVPSASISAPRITDVLTCPGHLALRCCGGRVLCVLDNVPPSSSSSSLGTPPHLDRIFQLICNYEKQLASVITPSIIHEEAPLRVPCDQPVLVVSDEHPFLLVAFDEWENGKQVLLALRRTGSLCLWVWDAVKMLWIPARSKPLFEPRTEVEKAIYCHQSRCIIWVERTPASAPSSASGPTRGWIARYRFVSIEQQQISSNLIASSSGIAAAFRKPPQQAFSTPQQPAIHEELLISLSAAFTIFSLSPTPSASSDFIFSCPNFNGRVTTAVSKSPNTTADAFDVLESTNGIYLVTLDRIFNIPIPSLASASSIHLVSSSKDDKEKDKFSGLCPFQSLRITRSTPSSSSPSSGSGSGSSSRSIQLGAYCIHPFTREFIFISPSASSTSSQPQPQQLHVMTLSPSDTTLFSLCTKRISTLSLSAASLSPSSLLSQSPTSSPSALFFAQPTTLALLFQDNCYFFDLMSGIFFSRIGLPSDSVSPSSLCKPWRTFSFDKRSGIFGQHAMYILQCPPVTELARNAIASFTKLQQTLPSVSSDIPESIDQQTSSSSSSSSLALGSLRGRKKSAASSSSSSAALSAQNKKKLMSEMIRNLEGLSQSMALWGLEGWRTRLLLEQLLLTSLASPSFSGAQEALSDADHQRPDYEALSSSLISAFSSSETPALAWPLLTTPIQRIEFRPYMERVLESFRVAAAAEGPSASQQQHAQQQQQQQHQVFDLQLEGSRLEDMIIAAEEEPAAVAAPTGRNQYDSASLQIAQEQQARFTPLNAMLAKTLERGSALADSEVAAVVAHTTLQSSMESIVTESVQQRPQLLHVVDAFTASGRIRASSRSAASFLPDSPDSNSRRRRASSAAAMTSPLYSRLLSVDESSLSRPRKPSMLSSASDLFAAKAAAARMRPVVAPPSPVIASPVPRTPPSASPELDNKCDAAAAAVEPVAIAVVDLVHASPLRLESVARRLALPLLRQLLAFVGLPRFLSLSPFAPTPSPSPSPLPSAIYPCPLYLPFSTNGTTTHENGQMMPLLSGASLHPFLALVDSAWCPSSPVVSPTLSSSSGSSIKSSSSHPSLASLSTPSRHPPPVLVHPSPQLDKTPSSSAKSSPTKPSADDADPSSVVIDGQHGSLPLERISHLFEITCRLLFLHAPDLLPSFVLISFVASRPHLLPASAPSIPEHMLSSASLFASPLFLPFNPNMNQNDAYDDLSRFSAGVALLIRPFLCMQSASSSSKPSIALQQQCSLATLLDWAKKPVEAVELLLDAQRAKEAFALVRQHIQYSDDNVQHSELFRLLLNRALEYISSHNQSSKLQDEDGPELFDSSYWNELWSVIPSSFSALELLGHIKVSANSISGSIEHDQVASRLLDLLQDLVTDSSQASGQHSSMLSLPKVSDILQVLLKHAVAVKTA